MASSWDDEYLTVIEIAEHLKLNPQTIRNWIDAGSLPAVRVGRRVRIRRADLDRLLAQGTTATAQPQPAPATTGTPAEAVEQLCHALERARRLLGRRSATRRAELAEGLQDLTDAVATALQTLSADGRHPDPQ
jgi:excisionase family DNA binding protein